MSVIVLELLKTEFLIFYLISHICCSLFHLHSSGIELMNAAALLLLFLLNLLLVGRQERLKRSEMVWRLNGIITQLSGESVSHHWKYRLHIILAFVFPVQDNLFLSVRLEEVTLLHLTFINSICGNMLAYLLFQ